MKKVLCLVLSLAMLLSVVACAVPNLEEQGTRPVGNQPGNTDNSHVDPGLPSVWYDNRSFTIMGLEIVERENPARDIIYFEDVQSDTINEAVHDRNVYIEELYGVSIEAAWSTREEMHIDVERAISAGLPNCDAMETGLAFYASLADQGYLADFNSMSQYLDMSQSWWDQNACENLSLGGALYFTAGDIMITDKMATWAVSFNRDMITEYNLESPYDLVDSYKWTYDKMYEMAASVSDAEFHEEGDYFGTTWGLVSEPVNTYYLWFGCGNKIFTKNENDLPVLNSIGESAYDAMMDIASMHFDKNVTLFQRDMKGYTSFFDGTIKIFQTGHSLFFCGSTTMIEWMREYDMDFGVLPMPIANEEQRNYHAGISNTQSCGLAVPRYSDYTQDNYDFIGIVLQALACESTATLLEAYYDKTLTYRGLRRPEDQRMLDLIFEGRVYDLSLVFSWADALIGELSGATTEGKIKRLKSYYDSYANSVNKKVNDYLTKHGLI